MFKGKRYITFDCYGTLIDWEDGIREAIRKMSEKNGFNLDLNNISDKYIKAELEVEQNNIENIMKFYNSQ